VTEENDIPQEEVEALRDRLDREAEQSGYHLNPDGDFTADLARGLIINEKRYGYRSCPCRLAAGDAAADLDIVCPCDYRDPDLTDWGACYCALYVSKDVLTGRRALEPVPERRLPGGPAVSEKPDRRDTPAGEPGVTVWRCRVCGYLCGREEPPETCPICRASRERFERFWG
jgi:ferredoxin-thioredoxin reductase catalytic chain